MSDDSPRTVMIRTELPEDQHRELKAAAALAGETLLDYTATAIMQRVARDKATRTTTTNDRTDSTGKEG